MTSQPGDHQQASDRQPDVQQGPDCHQILESMYVFLDQECVEGQREHVQAHLDDCSPCLEAFAFEAELKQVIARKCRDDVPSDLVASVKERLRIEIAMQAPDSSSDNDPPKGISAP